MTKLIFMIVILIHGLIHLMGFAREYQLSENKILSGKTIIPLSPGLAKIAGVMWLFTALLFLLTLAYLNLGRMDWWLPAVIAILFSQFLIILYWPDAKFGTLANIIILIACIPAIGSWNMQRMVSAEVDELLAAPRPSQSIITTDSLNTLPPLVQKWLQNSGVVDNPPARFVHVHQKGEMRTSADSKWMPFQAEQHFCVHEPAFIWKAKVQSAPLVYIQARDRYMNGHGNMLIKLLSIFPIADASGEKMDQGTLVRYLSEIVWFPSAALEPYISWAQVDDSHAQATMTYQGRTAVALFEFNENGDVVSFLADRYFETDENAKLWPWLITIDPDGYTEFEGVRIPAKASVTWKFDTGDYTWLHLEVTDVNY